MFKRFGKWLLTTLIEEVVAELLKQNETKTP
jgi:hypothetical protein